MDFEVLPGPPLAELARTAVASAAAATVSCGRAGGGASAAAPVAMRADAAGQPILLPAADSALARELAGQPASVTVRILARPPFAALRLTGTVRPGGLGGRSERGWPPCFAVSLDSASFDGAIPAPVPLALYRAAEPDPLWRQAPAVLQHLEREHMAELIACTRAHGMPQADWVVPSGLDRFGLKLLVFTMDGVTEARLSFPDGPVTSLAQVPASLRTVLSCRCRPA